MIFENKNVAGLAIWGTKVGMKSFLTCNLAEPINTGKEPFRDADSLFIDLAPYRPGSSAMPFLIQRMSDFTCINGYWGAYDDLERKGFLVISILLPSGKVMKGEPLFSLLLRITEIYWNNYISKSTTGASIKNYFVEEKQLFAPLLHLPDFALTDASDVAISKIGNYIGAFEYSYMDEAARVLSNLFTDELMHYKQLYLMPVVGGAALRDSDVLITAIPEVKKKYQLSIYFEDAQSGNKLTNVTVSAYKDGIAIQLQGLVRDGEMSIEGIKEGEGIKLQLKKTGYIDYDVTERDVAGLLENAYGKELPKVASIKIFMSREPQSAGNEAGSKGGKSGGNTYDNGGGNPYTNGKDKCNITIKFSDRQSGKEINPSELQIHRNKTTETQFNLARPQFIISNIKVKEDLALTVKKKGYVTAHVSSDEVKKRLDYYVDGGKFYKQPDPLTIQLRKNRIRILLPLLAAAAGLLIVATLAFIFRCAIFEVGCETVATQITDSTKLKQKLDSLHAAFLKSDSAFRSKKGDTVAFKNEAASFLRQFDSLFDKENANLGTSDGKYLKWKEDMRSSLAIATKSVEKPPIVSDPQDSAQPGEKKIEKPGDNVTDPPRPELPEEKFKEIDDFTNEREYANLEKAQRYINELEGFSKSKNKWQTARNYLDDYKAYCNLARRIANASKAQDLPAIDEINKLGDRGKFKGRGDLINKLKTALGGKVFNK